MFSTTTNILLRSAPGYKPNGPSNHAFAEATRYANAAEDTSMHREEDSNSQAAHIHRPLARRTW